MPRTVSNTKEVYGIIESEDLGNEGLRTEMKKEENSERRETV